MVDQYYFSGGLPEENSTYVKRHADDQLYLGLKAGEFCYVLNSSQSGKTSLRVRTMRRLQEDGVECAAIDLSAVGIDSVCSQEQWYNSLVDSLIDYFELDVKFEEWWEQNQSYSVVSRFRKFLSQILLAQIKQDIVIFIDEIGTVLKLKFSTDDFFGLIRFCYQQRADNPEYKRLTFCLLGIASPGSLIQDKNSTPFNIGTPIYLKPFQLGKEVEPLKNGLQGRCSKPDKVIEEILYWTGGQPFLTQKLCHFMVVESQAKNPRTVEQVVRDRMIENWEFQDEPQHLRTIKNSILKHEKLAPDLLELYRRVQENGIIADNTLEQYELQLSGLVVKEQNKLRVYNRIYQDIFDINWIETQLNNLRPYSENLRAWVVYGKTDKSRLLKGNALQEALKWASNKNISYEDREYLGRSQHEESQEKIAAADQLAALERERKNREAAEERNQVLREANKKAQLLIRFGFLVFAVTALGAVITWWLSKKQVDETKEVINIVQQLNTQSGELQAEDRPAYYEALRLAALTYNIDNRKLKLALAFAATSQVKQEQDKIKEAKQEINKSQKLLSEVDKNALYSPQGVQIKILFEKYKGSLLAKEKATQKEAIKYYNTAFNNWKSHPNETDFTKNNQLLTTENVESIHRGLIKLLSKNNTEKKLRKQVENSLTEYMYTQLEYYLKNNNNNFFASDDKTYQLILNIAKKDDDALDTNSINNLSCPDLQRIDNLWVKYSQGKFGFSVQKNIFLATGNKLDRYDESVYRSFGSRIGWYDQERDQKTNGNGWLNRGQLKYRIDAPKGHLPGNGSFWLWSGTVGLHEGWRFSSRTAACTLSSPKLTKHD